MNKPLTDVQRDHLQNLLNEAEKSQAASNAAIQSFVTYLSTEHGAPPEDGWKLSDIDVGFVLEEDQSPNGQVPTEMAQSAPVRSMS